jgi:CubicO group peptidase (beta-lactamase class C family)
VQDILHLKTPSGGEPVDPRFNQITVQNLLEQDSGLVTEYTGEDPQVAAAFHRPLPATQEETGSYMMLKHMEANPGALKKYSNFGYWILGRVVSKLRGKQYFIDAIISHISDPLAITRLRVSRSLTSAQAPDEAGYHSPDLTLQTSVMSPGQPPVSRDYGDENLEKMEPSGGLSVAPVDYARVLAALNIKSSNQPLLPNSEITSMLTLAAKSYRGHGFDGMNQIRPGIFNRQKGGLLETSQDSIYYTTGGISFIVCLNTVGVGGDWYPNFPEVVNAAMNTNWSPVDLFPQYGMPSF